MDPAQPPTPEDLEALAQWMTDAMRAQGVTGEIDYDHENQRLLGEGTDPVPVAALALQLSRAPETERADMLRRYVAAFLRGRPTIETWDEARQVVLPKIRPEVESASWALRSRLEGFEYPVMPMGRVTEHLRVQFVWEIEDGVATVHAGDVERWGVTLDELQDAAAENLVSRTPDLSSWLGAPSSPGVYRSPWRDGFDATRVMLAGDFGVPCKDALVAIATGDSELYLADAGDEDAMFQLGLVAQRRFHVAPGMVWLWPLRLEGEERTHWLPEAASGAFAPLSVCAALHAQVVYNQHGQYLQRVLETEGSPTRVGPVGMIQSPLGAAATVAVWQAGAPAALARADFIQFRRGDLQLGFAPWPEVMELVGAGIEESPGYPLRYRAPDFPEDWQLAALGVDAAG